MSNMSTSPASFLNELERMQQGHWCSDATFLLPLDDAGCVTFLQDHGDALVAQFAIDRKLCKVALKMEQQPPLSLSSPGSDNDDNNNRRRAIERMCRGVHTLPLLHTLEITAHVNGAAFLLDCLDNIRFVTLKLVTKVVRRSLVVANERRSYVSGDADGLVEALQRHRTLQKLSVEAQNYDHVWLIASTVGNMNQLKSLKMSMAHVLSQAVIDDDGALNCLLQNSKHLDELILEHFWFKTRATKQALSSLLFEGQLRSLHLLPGCHYDETSFLALCSWLGHARGQGLRSLWISLGDFQPSSSNDDDGDRMVGSSPAQQCILLAQALSLNEGLHKLQISIQPSDDDNHGDGLVEILAALQQHPSVQSFSWLNNPCWNRTMTMALCHFLVLPSSVRHLKIDVALPTDDDDGFPCEDHQFQSNDIRAIFESLGKNTTLEAFELMYRHPMEPIVFERAVASLRSNRGLRELLILGDPDHHTDVKQTLQMLEACLTALKDNGRVRVIRTGDLDDIAPDEYRRLLTLIQSNYYLESMQLSDDCDFRRYEMERYVRAGLDHPYQGVMSLETMRLRRNIHTILRLNRHGRQYLVESTTKWDRECGVAVLNRVVDDLECLYVHLLENPSLCDRHSTDMEM